MELDVPTLRVAFAATSAISLVYLLAQPARRSAYGAWWAAALVLFNVGSAAYGLNESHQDAWTQPWANAMLALGAASTWGAVRALHGVTTRIPWVVVTGGVVWLASFLDDGGEEGWAGRTLFLTLMVACFALAAYELSRSWRTGSAAHRAMAVIGAATSLYFLRRLVWFVVDGSGAADEDLIPEAFSSVIKLLVLIAVVFCMLVLSNEQSSKELRRRATRDDLTGLLNRAEFNRLTAADAFRRRDDPGVVIMADLDHFKQVNDTYGHDAGDRALQAFARACEQSVRSTDLVCRHGGEEFVLLLPGVTLDRAELVTESISARLRDAEAYAGRMPTVSFGMASTATGVDLATTIAQADAALYRAKRLGRDRSVRHTGDGSVPGVRGG